MIFMIKNFKVHNMFSKPVNKIVCERGRVTVATSNNRYFPIKVVTSLTYSNRPDLTSVLTVRQKGNHLGKKTIVNK